MRLAIGFASLLFLAACVSQPDSGPTSQPSTDAAGQNVSALDCSTPPTDALLIEACTQTIESGQLSDGDLAIAYNLRGAAYIRQGQDALAIDDFSEAIRLNPEFAKPYINRGAAYFNSGQSQLALQDLENAVRLDPEDDAGHFNRGILYFDQGDYDRALEDLNEAIRLRPDNPAAYNIRGIIYSALDDAERARADFETAEQLSS
ncbi:MAG: tetratricopeptide repeat protein [Pseudomonadota bacterium]